MSTARAQARPAGPGGSPALLDTRAHLPSHESRHQAAISRDSETLTDTLRPPLGRAPRWNPWCDEAIAARRRAAIELGAAYAAAGRDLRAKKVEGCGLPEGIALGPHGGNLRSRAGVPAAIVVRCGSRLCATCARDVARRQRRRILERLEELEARDRLTGPVCTPQPKRKGPAVRDILAAIEDHSDAAATAAAALDAKFAELGDMPWADDEEDEEYARRELAEAACPVPVLQLPKQGRAPRPMARMVPLASCCTCGDEKCGRGADGKQIGCGRRQRAARLVVPFERLVPLAVSRCRCGDVPSCVCGASDQRRAILVADVVRAPRQQRRPPSDTRVELVPIVGEGLDDGGALLDRAVRTGAARRTAASFRVGLPPSKNAYGCRFLTLTHPARPGEPLEETFDRFEDALDRFQSSATWSAYVDGHVTRLEFEDSTPEKRKARAAELQAEGRHAEAAAMRASTATWWHVHAHILVWGRRWPQKTACLDVDEHGPIHWGHTAHRLRDTRHPMFHGRVPCSCTRCSGVDDESSLLAGWRRALVETKRYAPELAGVEFADGPEMAGGTRPYARRARFNAAVLVESGQGAILDRLRRYRHRCNGGTWARALVDVKIGGAHIKTPSRTRAGERLESPWAALCEVVKYSTKAVTLGSMSLERVVEVIRATDNRRLVRSGGILFGVEKLEDDKEEARIEAEGVEREAGLGEYAFDESGRVVDSDEFVWVKPGDERFAAAFDERHRLLRELHDFHEQRRAQRRAERNATGPPDRGRNRVQRPEIA